MTPRVLLSVLVLASCQSSGADTSAKPAPTQAAGTIEVRDAAGVVVARVIPGHPCRATIDRVELQVGTDPLVAQVGANRWSGKLATNGTTISRDDLPVVRMFAGSPTDVALFDLEGVALMRANVTGDKAAIADRASTIVRTIERKGADLVVTGVGAGDAALTVTGTTDLLLAAVITATETSPEVRGLAACHRLFPSEGRPESFGP